MAETIEGKATTGTFVREEAASTRFHTASKSYSYMRDGALNDAWTYVYTNLPANLAGRDVTAAWLEVEMVPGTGSRTITVQRHVKPTTSYANMTWNSRAVALGGSTAVAVTQDSADTTWIFDVTADLQAISLGGAYYGWRFTTSHTSQWRMHGWTSADAVRLFVELDGVPDAPEELTPDGVTALAAPIFTWLADDELISAQLQVAAVDAVWTAADGFTSPLWDSGVVSTEIAQLDSDALGWTGMAEDDVVEVTAQHTTSGGTSDWCDPVTLTRKALPTLTIDSPTGTTEDPTPTITWTASEQDRYVVTLLSGTTTLYASPTLPGDASGFAIPDGKGAKTAGQSLTARVRVYPLDEHSPSPGDPGYTEVTETFTYTPGAATAVTSLVAVQDGVNPWVDLAWSRDDVPDEYLILRDGTQIARFDGLDEDSDSVISYRDWTCPPNTDVVYNVQPIVEGSAGANGPTAPLRLVVTGEWVVDPEAGVYFTTTGEQSALTYTDATATYDIPGADFAVTRTFGMHGLSGPGGGAMENYDDRTVAEQESDVYAVKGAPNTTYRYVMGDLNIPGFVTAMNLIVDKDRSQALPVPQARRIIKQVTFTVTQNGELPFPQVSP